ncbi:LLM class flavin-dependent oxidoreductase [Nocardioides jishulii]|uniref:LLM class flavin-dependent oxidoreductase n=1 Tax=Nocardioides jishulii TaxID=2575440 RepID=A0A4U2YR71_9ACTN|nr:LLM class flavin-dependent oxidoreductase [Nocardioides jishulii]QCX26289.1 LLM class flavin-dependent oxidoreductase [Nocardioides jishulii]TKI63907.1 LLM class flavin-dependent oxidoreductase [Nocardioides jishulii]
MPKPTRHLALNAFLMSAGHHEAAWRSNATEPDDYLSLEHVVELARTAERGLLDSIFFADVPVLGHPDRRPSESLDPTVKLAAIAAATSRIGLIGTASTTVEEPYNLARRFASLDRLSKGRAGWNVVTTATDAVGANYGITEWPGHEERYRRADEFVDVTLKLWNSWRPDAVVGDRAEGVWADPSRVQPIHHRGEFFDVAGPLTVGRSPQGHPVVVQAGSSGPGIALAAKYAEAIFTAQRTIEDGRSFYAELKAATRRAGRNPDHIKILPGIVTVLGGTEAEATARADALDDLIVLRHPHEQLAHQTGLAVDQLPLDEPLPAAVRAPDDNTGSRYALTLELARREDLTVRQLLRRLGGGRGHRVFAGTPEQVADTIELWFTTGASDGFNVMPATLPDTLEDFVDHVVPILQQRGLFRTAYEGSTLREHYGLPVPGEGALAGVSRAG